MNNALWIAGESYGGILAPYTAVKLDKWINDTKALSPEAWVPQLKGLVIGNGFVNFKYDGKPAFVPMSFYHGLIDDELHDYMKIHCDFSYSYIRGNRTLSKFC